MSVEWPQVALGDLLRIEHGFAFKGRYFGSEGNDLVLTPGNFKIGGGLQMRPGKQKYYSGPYPKKFKLAPGDLLIAMTDLTQNAPILGSPLVIPPEGTYLHNQRLGKVQILDEKRLDRRFVYYLFASDIVRAQLRGSATGATVRHTAPGRVAVAVAKLPPLGFQERIGAILSAYDDLIENNTRRIKILEDMAQSIYKEWFVDFRYPGHENVPLVDSALGPIPDGWEVRRLRDIVQLKYGKALRANDRRPGPFPVYGSGGVTGWHDKCLVRGPGIVVGRKGNVGSVFLCTGDFYPIDTTYYVDTEMPIRFTWHLLRRLEFIDSHAAVPGLSRDQAYALPVLVPPRTLVASYEELALHLLTLSAHLENSNKLLRDIRDMLLPRLVSGEIDVPGLPLSE